MNPGRDMRTGEFVEFVGVQNGLTALVLHQPEVLNPCFGVEFGLALPITIAGLRIPLRRRAGLRSRRCSRFKVAVESKTVMSGSGRCVGLSFTVISRRTRRLRGSVRRKCVLKKIEAELLKWACGPTRTRLPSIGSVCGGRSGRWSRSSAVNPPSGGNIHSGTGVRLVTLMVTPVIVPVCRGQAWPGRM
jgi:hypothetical protein